VRFRVVLQDPKTPGSDRDLIFLPEDAAPNTDEAKHMVALLALHSLVRDHPLERKLPDPYRALWLTMAGGRADGPEGGEALNGKKAKKAKAAAKRAAAAAAATADAAVAGAPPPTAAAPPAAGAPPPPLSAAPAPAPAPARAPAPSTAL